jgi:uncharacterized protein (TIGR00251 family)
MDPIEQAEVGVILRVKAQPGGRSNEIRGVREGQLLVCVTQIAEKGKANRAVIEVLAKSLGLKRSQIQLLTGETAHEKRFLIHDTPCETLRQQIAELVSGT